MPDGNLARFQEIANRGLQEQLPADARARFDEALRRGLLTGPEVAAIPERAGIGKRLLGAGETTLSLLTGAAAQPIAGVAGVIEGISEFVSGGDASEAAAERVQQISQALTFEPRTEEGREIMEMVGRPFQALGEAAELAGQREFEQRGPVTATAMQTAMELIPGALGLRGPRRAIKARQERRAVEQAAQDLDIDLDAATPAQRRQVIEAAERLTGGRVARAEGLEEVQVAIQNARNVAKQEVDNLYTAARSEQAGVAVAQARDFNQIARNALADFDIEAMPIVQRRLNELEGIAELPENAIIKLNAIAQWRQRINRNKPDATDTSQQAALGILRGQLDSFLDSQFNADMITGNPAAINKWRVANRAFSEYKKTFDENKTIRQLGQQQATPEEIRQWIFGASSVGAKKQAGDTVRRIKEVIGEDSSQMTSLRQDALFDIVEPLIREDPNFKQFATNYDRFVRNNPTLRNELFPESVSGLDQLRSLASAIEKAPGTKLGFDFNQAASRALFGHGIAKAGLRVSVMAQMFRLMRSAVGKPNKQRIMESILGYDPRGPVLPAVSIIGMGQTLMEDQDGR